MALFRQVLGPISARDNGHMTEAWPADLYVLASPRSPTRFAKVVGASPRLLYLRAYSAPPGLRWLETGVPDLHIYAQPADQDARIVEVTSSTKSWREVSPRSITCSLRRSSRR
jgi:hypothetical protein